MEGHATHAGLTKMAATIETRRNQGVVFGDNLSSTLRSRDCHPVPSMEKGLLTQQAQLVAALLCCRENVIVFIWNKL